MAGETLRVVRSWVVKLALIATAPVWVPVALLALVTEVYFLPGELRVKRQMRHAGRVMRWRQLKQHLRARAGTLIVEYPTPGWQFSRVWWTPDRLEKPVRPATDPDCPWVDAAAEEYHVRFTSLDQGSAQLVAVWCGRRVASFLRWRYPGIRVLAYMSFGAERPQFTEGAS